VRAFIEFSMHARGTSCSRSMVTGSKAIFSYLSGAVCPFPHPKGFSHSPRQAAGPASVPQARCGATYFGGAWVDSPPTSKPARPALHHRVALALTAAVDRSRAAELSDELKKPLQALREAGRAKPRRIFAATFFRLHHVGPNSRSNVSQLVTLCLTSPDPWAPIWSVGRCRSSGFRAAPARVNVRRDQPKRTAASASEKAFSVIRPLELASGMAGLIPLLPICIVGWLIAGHTGAMVGLVLSGIIGAIVIGVSSAKS